MVTLLLLFVLAWQFYIGYSNGLLKQVYLFIALLIALVVACQTYDSLVAQFSLWIPYAQVGQEVQLPFFSTVNTFDMDRVFYAGLSFVLIFLLTYGGFKLFSFLIQLIPFDDWIEQRFYRLIAGATSLLTTLISWSLGLNLLATIPYNPLQQLLSQTALLKIITQLPLISQLVKHFWVTQLMG